MLVKTGEPTGQSDEFRVQLRAEAGSKRPGTINNLRRAIERQRNAFSTRRAQQEIKTLPALDTRRAEVAGTKGGPSY